MAKNLVIIEAPGKLPKYRKALGSDYDVLATAGHCVDLPEKSLAINIKKKFEPTWEVKHDKKAVIKTLKDAAKKAQNIYLMSDEDREGEAIAWHVLEQIKTSTKANIFRATTNEITASGIKKALANPGQIDMQKIDAYLCRRLLDRLCGYKTSFLTKQATGGRSAGRVQSAILRLIVDREKEIMHFVPEEYWVLTAHLLNSSAEPYVGVLSEKIKVPNEAEATKIYNAVMKGSPVISEVKVKQVNIKPFAPFTTIPLQATASTLFGWSGKRTMQAAQHLYEAGHITYMRTDSPFMAKEAVDAVRAFVDHSYGSKYLPAKAPVYAAKKGAQEAHECCRVTDVNANPALAGDEHKLYEVIRKRTIASQMSSGVDERIRAVTKIAGYDFISNGNRQIFDGFRKVWDVGGGKDVLLPKLTEGEKCTLKLLEKEQKFTQPPPRYSVASIGKKCEDEQIARPATFSNFMEVLQQRGYIAKNKKSFQATDLGIKVIDFLTAADFCFVDVKFTAGMEQELDAVQSATTNKVDLLTKFWDRLKGDIEKGKEVRNAASVTKYKCPKCKGSLLSKFSKFGPFYACENYKPPKKVDGKKVEQEGACAFTAKVGDNGEPIEKVAKPKEYADFACTKCGAPMVKRTSKYGEFYGCEGYPKCKMTADMDGNFKEPKKKHKAKAK